MYFRLLLLITAAVLIGGTAFAGVPGTYVDANVTNTTSAANPWYVTGSGTWDDNLWAYRQDFGQGSTVFEGGPSVGYPPYVEDVPVITTGVDVLQGSYEVYLVYWVHRDADYWTTRAAISGQTLQNYDKFNGTPTGLTQADGAVIQMYALLGTVENTNRIEVNVDGPAIEWSRAWYDGISYKSTGQQINISGTYVDATTQNTSSTTNPWYVVGGGTWNDNLWAARTDYGIDSTVFEAGSTNYETVPVITTNVNVPKGSYKVYVYFWSHKDAWWGIGAAIQGRAFEYYYWKDGVGNATPTGLTQGNGDLIHLKAYLGDVIDTQNIKVDLRNVYWADDRTWYDGISYELLDVSIKGTYVDADTVNTTSQVNPYYVVGGGAFNDNLWTLRNDELAGIGLTSWEAGPVAQENAPLLTTRVSVPKGSYNVWVYYWSYTAGFWGVGAALRGEPIMPFHYTVDTGYSLDGGNLKLLRAYVGTVSDTDLIEVDIDQHFWSEINRTRYDGISYEPVPIIGKYVDANPNNTDSLTQPWYVLGDGTFEDDLWAVRKSINTPDHGYGNHGLNHSLLETGPITSEDSPLITTTVNVPFGAYTVYAYYWLGPGGGNWGISAALSGQELVNWLFNGYDTGIRSTNNQVLMRAPLGLKVNTSQIKVDVDQHSWASVLRGRYDGISYERTGLTGVYVDATEQNTVLKEDPQGIWLGNQGYYDDLWEKRTDYGIEKTVFEGGPLANDPENLWEDVPVITTSTSVPQGTYKVYVYFWSSVNSSWGLKAAISNQTLVQYDPNNAELVATLGELQLLRAFLGIAADTNQISVDVDGIEGPYWTRSWYDGIGYEEVIIQTLPLADAKKAADGTAVKIEDLIVSAVFGNVFYAQTENRTMGIQVRKSNHGLAVGNVVDVRGTMKTDPNTGERYIDATGESISGSPGPAPKPLGMINKSLGGSDFGTPPEGQRGVTGGVGLNNVGLLVRTFGQVLDHTVNGFVIDDGSNLPLRVVYSGTLPDVSTFVVVDGISSLQLVGSNVERLLLATSWE